MKYIRKNRFAPTTLVWNSCERGARTTAESFPKMGNVDVPMMKTEAENFQYMIDAGLTEMFTISSVYSIN